jgi:hypothetical protein
MALRGSRPARASSCSSSLKPPHLLTRPPALCRPGRPCANAPRGTDAASRLTPARAAASELGSSKADGSLPSSAIAAATATATTATSTIGVVAAATAAGPTAPTTSSAATATSSFSSRDDDEDTDAAEGAAGGAPGADASFSAADLFDASHLPPLNEWPLDLLLYFPLGVALASVRLALWVACIALDLPSFRSRQAVDSYLRLLGVTVSWRHAERLPARGERHVLVSNHVSVGDLMMLFAVPDEGVEGEAGAIPSDGAGQAAAVGGSSTTTSSSTSSRRRYVHLVTSALPGAVTATRHLPALLRPASRATYDRLAGVAGAAAADRRQRRQRGAATADDQGQAEEELSAPVHVFPEGGMTHGRAAMLSFSRGFTRLLNGGGQAGAGGSPLPVVPVALRLRAHPAARLVRSHTLTSGFLSNLFWFSFPLWTELEATALPALVWEPEITGESRGAFVRRVQRIVAEELGVGVAALTVQQKRQLAPVVGADAPGADGAKEAGEDAAAARGR